MTWRQNFALHHTDPPPKVTHRNFHLLEFWTSCVYSIVETFALVMSPKTMLHIYSKPNLLKLLLFFNVVNSLVPALMMTLDFHYFEKMAHELEFINSFTLSFVTMILLASLLNPPSLDEANLNLPFTQNNNNNSQQQLSNDDKSSIIMGFVACAVAASNFFIYNIGQHAAAHYLEFSFNIVVSLVTFWFCLDNRFMAQMEIAQILYGKHQNCIFCQIRSNDLSAQMQSNERYQFMFGDTDNDNSNSNNKRTSEILTPIRGAIAVDEPTITKRYSKNNSNGASPSRPAAFTQKNDEEAQTENTPLLTSNNTPSQSGTVVSIESDAHFRQIIAQEPMVVVKVTAEWNRTCKEVYPLFASLSQKYTSATFCTANVDALEEVISEYYHVDTTPTFLVFRNGNLRGAKTGMDPLEDFVETELKLQAGFYPL